MNRQTQKIACPVFLRKRLQAYRVGEGEEQSYLVTNSQSGKSYRFEPWQFFILEVLPGCENFSKLASVFEDRFGHSISREEVEGMFDLVADNKLFGISAVTNPILAEYHKKRTGRKNKVKREEPVQKPMADTQQKKKKKGKKVETKIDDLPAGVQDAVGFDERTKKGIKLFNPSWLIKVFHPVFAPLKNIIYVLPTLLIATIFVLYNNFGLLEQDLVRLFSSYTFIEHILFGMVTVNLSATLVTAFVAQSFRASPFAFCIVFYFGVIPRFMVRLSNVKQLTRRERMWLHASPLLLRGVYFSVGALLWFTTLAKSELVSLFGLSIATISLISFIITVNPLLKGNGYHLLSTFLDEPHLKGKAYKHLWNKFKGNVYEEADNNLLVTYALVSSVFILLFVAIVVYLLGNFFKMQFGGAGVLLTILIVFLILKRITTKFKEVDDAYERSVQFERWRKRSLPSDKKKTVKKKPKRTIFSYLKCSAVILFFALLFIPYPFQPGGKFVILPTQQQEIVSDISGIIEEIHSDGGEILSKGSVILRLNSDEYASQEKIYSARILEQQAVIAELKSRPLPEEIQLAESSLEVQKTQLKFSKAKVVRLEKLYKERATSFEELDDARRDYRVDLDQVDEKKANLELVKLGTPPDEIAAAEAKLVSLEEQRNFYQDKIDKSTIYMPFTGRLVTMHLKQKIGSYLEKGKPLTVVENTQQVVAQIDVSEPDINYIIENARTTIRPRSIQDNDFYGVVTAIAPNVEKMRFGKVVRVDTVIENQNEILKSGMTGYAKIESSTKPAWKIFSLALVRFFRVEVWSWIP